jgi:hypothetical protein
MNLTPDRLRAMVNYSRSTGEFTWAEQRTNRCPLGGAAGWTDEDGYVHIRLDGRLYLAHRLAWLYVHGEWPAGLLDHKNRNPGDNRIANLRLASHSQNHANTAKRADNKSGFKGVCWSTAANRWRASIKYGSTVKFLGHFDDPKDAAAAYDAAAKLAFAEFSATNEVA